MWSWQRTPFTKLALLSGEHWTRSRQSEVAACSGNEQFGVIQSYVERYAPSLLKSCNPILAALTVQLQVLHQLAGDRQTLRVEAFNLVHAGARFLCQGVDVDLAMGENQAHADGGVAQAVDRVRPS